MLKENIKARSAKAELEEFNKYRRPFSTGEILRFRGVGQNDVYNPSIPFDIDGERVIAGRVEKRDSEKAATIFFRKDGDAWTPKENAPVFELQDPFISQIGEELVVGGVRVIWEDAKIVSWVTDFYRGTKLENLEYFTSGPNHMKDIRLIELPEGRIGIFSRPQGEKVKEKYGCIAKIGFVLVDSLEGVTMEVIDNAPLLEGYFLPNEWGGCNQLYLLENGLIGAIGHKAWGEEIDGEFVLHYYAMAFAIDSDTRRMTPLKIIATRDCFPESTAKKTRLKDVIFPSGIVRKGNSKAILYAGLSDCCVGKIEIEDPFTEYEAI
jgi:hypothetical protein